MTDPDEAIEEFLRKADAAYASMTEFSSRVEQVSISGIREVFEAADAGIEGRYPARRLRQRRGRHRRRGRLRHGDGVHRAACF